MVISSIILVNVQVSFSKNALHSPTTRAVASQFFNGVRATVQVSFVNKRVERAGNQWTEGACDVMLHVSSNNTTRSSHNIFYHPTSDNNENRLFPF